MAKIRIHELAKELGLENKAVLDLCETLNIGGKNSHSNSLSDDEADKIRRHVIRTAVASEKDGDIKEVRREGQLVTERRVGGSVIRRRKKDEEAVEPEEERATISLKSEDLPQSPALPTHAPDLAQEQKFRKDALAAADAIFKKVEPVTVAVTETVEVVQEVVAEPVVEPVEETPVVVPDNTAANELNELRKKHDIRAAKVLGKIELAEPVQKSDAAKPAQANAENGARTKVKKRRTEVIEEDDSASKRPKKKQVLNKKELVDYEGDREGWRSKKDRGGKKKSLNGKMSDIAPTKASKKVVKVDGQISVGEFSKQLGLKAGEVIGKLMSLGLMVNINQFIDTDTATLVAEEYGFTAQNVENNAESVVENLIEKDTEDKQRLRPPVVTVMGHVDHGKTSLLDAIRKTEVTQGEFGGITQHIGAYNVTLPSGGSVTFLDTPGHEAFTAMRSRGAKVTDIVVLVVAANDGVMPQTIEAINHAKAANVPIIVAVNKVDLPEANIDKVINQLSEHGLVPEDWGGDTLVVKVSAKKGIGLDSLLETLHLQSEILELKANFDRRANGTVIEARVDKGRGPVISVLVQNGTLRKGDSFVAGAVSGKVRALLSDDGQQLEEAGPSIPVEIIGVAGSAIAGDDFVVCANDVQAREIAEQREQILRKKRLANQASSAPTSSQLTLQRFSEIMSDSVEIKELPLVVKADVQGSVEAIVGTLSELANEEVRVKIIHKGVGAINENDVQLAAASGAILVAFNVRPDPRASMLIDQTGVEVLYSRVIYDIVEAVDAALKGKMSPKFKEKTLGHVEVRQTFRVPKLGVVAGSYVTDGVVERGAKVRLLRDGTVIFEGKMASLRRFKDDVKEVATGYECGIGLEGFSDVKNGDLMEIFKVEEVSL